MPLFLRASSANRASSSSTITTAVYPRAIVAAMVDEELVATRTLVVGGRAQRRVRTYKLVVETAGRDPEEHFHRASELRAGARPENDVVIADESVSRAHLEIV